MPFAALDLSSEIPGWTAGSKLFVKGMVAHKLNF